MDEGYVLIAANRAEYLEFALNLALSIRLNDGKRPVALLHDDSIKIAENYKSYFDKTILIGKDDEYFGSANKLLLYKYSPFQRTMYIDADCLMAKRDISTIWKKLKGFHFTVVGNKITEGERDTLDVLKLRKVLGLPYFVKHNAGVLYFDRSNIAARAFALMKSYIEEHRSDLFVPFRGAFADQPLIGAAMGALTLEPFPYVFRSFFRKKQWMQLLNSKAVEIDIDVIKGRSMFFTSAGDRNIQSPAILHFVGYRQPVDIYLRESNKLRQKFNLPLLSKDIAQKR